MSGTQSQSDDAVEKNRKRARDWYYANKERTLARTKKWQAENKDKVRKSRKKWKKNNPDKVRAGYKKQGLKSRYGITPEQFDALFSAQDKRCAICKSDTSAGNGFHVDHCHVTGTVRGILCHHCNTALGSFKENADVLRAAIQYIQQHSRPADAVLH